MKVRYSLSFVLITLFIFITCGAFAQSIRGGLILGINAAQVDGDNLGGFNKPGLNTGITAQMPFPKYNLLLRMDLLFSQKGSAPYLFSDPNDQTATAVTPYSLTLNYLEVPVVLDYIYKKRYGIGFGMSIGKLMGGSDVFNGYESSITIGPYATSSGILTGSYQPWDANAILDGLYAFKGDHWMVNLRWMYSMRFIAKNPPGNNSFYNNQTPPSFNNGYPLYPSSPSHFYNYGEFNNVIALRIVYVFGNIQKQ